MPSASTTACAAVRRRQPAGRRNERVLRPVHPNAGIAALYQKRLDALIEEMQASTVYWLRASYRADEPATIAQDETSAAAMRRSIRQLAARWNRRFDQAAQRLAEWFSTAVEKRSTDALRKILKDGGFTVDFKMTPAMRDALGATINANVALIKSIPQEYMTQVEGLVMRSVQTGRDLGQLTSDLQKRLGITKRRAATIARTQNNMATASITRARQMEAGITEAVWLHSGGGKHPRPTHVAASGKRYEIDKGMYLDGEWLQPGQAINCRCVGKSVVPGF